VVSGTVRPSFHAHTGNGRWSPSVSNVLLAKTVRGTGDQSSGFMLLVTGPAS
jgi:hypothetical protein